MAPAARDLALERARRYLERCGVAGSPELEAELEGVLAEGGADSEGAPGLAQLIDRLWGHLEGCRPAAPVATPAIHRASMGHG